MLVGSWFFPLHKELVVCRRNILWDWALVDTREAGENIEIALELPLEVRDGRMFCLSAQEERRWEREFGSCGQCPDS